MSDLPEESIALRGDLIEAMRTAHAAGLSVNTSGNASVQCRRGTRDGFLVTPSGLACHEIDVDDVVFVDSSGAATGRCKPSTEWHLHAAIYADRSDVGAIVHTHSPHATALACHRLPIPAFHYMVSAAGGSDIRCAEYATFGTPELARATLAALRGRTACLLANHGVVACGRELRSALALAIEVENLARMYVAARTLGDPVLLDEAEMTRVVRRFREYGQETSSR
jgi:L-fuculose-phosphate aldolase